MKASGSTTDVSLNVGQNTITIDAIDTSTGLTSTYTITVTRLNTLPNRKSGVSETDTASIHAGTAYALDLSTIFEDADRDSLTYKVMKDGQTRNLSVKNYAYTPMVTGTTTLIFKAKDGWDDSADTYTVTLTATAAPTPTPTPVPSSSPTAMPKPAATATNGEEDVPDTGDDAAEMQEITPETIDKNDDGVVTVTLNTDILPEGTQSVHLPDGTVVGLIGDETLTLTVSADMIDDGKVQLVALSNEGVPLGSFEVQTDNGVLIDVSGMDTAGGGFISVLWWILGIAAGLGIIALVVYLVLRKRRGE